MKRFAISNYGANWDIIGFIYGAISPIDALRQFYAELNRTRHITSPYLQEFIYEANEMP